MEERLFDLWFALSAGAGNRDFPWILKQYDNTYNVFEADEAEIESLPCSKAFKQKLMNKSLDQAKAVYASCLKHDIQILLWQDTDYPASLRTLQDPPAVLFYKGTMPDFSSRLCISVVGTRRMSEYGKRMAYKIGYELGAAGAVVVSGMALGVDGVAAAGTLLAGGTTVAVLGSGLAKPYPAEHQRLFDEIVEKGVVMSEYPPDTPPNKWQFPARNRIVSGLSQGTVVVEAPKHSGTLITARDAILQGRDIYAFPGNVGNVNAAGSNQLISDGAAVVLRARDVLQNYLYLYKDDLDMDRLAHAERRSSVDEAWMAKLGVVRQGWKPRENPPLTTAPSAPPAPPVKHETRGETPPPAPPKPPKSVPAKGDASNAVLQSLTDVQRRIFEALPLDHAVTMDYLLSEGFTVGEITLAMTVLEIKGLTVSLPGGLFSRK